MTNKKPRAYYDLYVRGQFEEEFRHKREAVRYAKALAKGDSDYGYFGTKIPAKDITLYYISAVEVPLD